VPKLIADTLGVMTLWLRILTWVSGMPAGALFVFAGVGKLIDPGPTIEAMIVVGLDRGVASAIVHVVAPVETALGLSLALAWRSRFVFASSIGMLFIFTAYLLIL